MYKSKFSENNTDDSRTVIESKGVEYLPLDFSSDLSEEVDTQKKYNPLDLLFGNLDSFSNLSVLGVDFNGYKPRYSDLDFQSTGDTDVDIGIDTSADTSTHTNETFTKESFKAKMLPLYEQALEMRGLDKAFARPLVAQDGLETRGNATVGRFNYGNITGKSGVTRNVKEYINNEGTTKNQTFVNYASAWDYVNAKVDLLLRLYDVFNHPVNEFAQRVKAGGYATAPTYVEDLDDVIRTLRRGGILKFDGGGKYLEQEREHYNQQVNFNSLLPVFNIPYNLTKHKLNNVQVKHNAPGLLKDEWDGYNGVYNTVTNTIHINDNYPNPTIAENHEKGHIIGQPLVRNVENLIKKGDGNIFEDGVTKDSYYDSPKEILARMYAYLMDSGYGGNKTVRDTLQFIRDERDRFTTEINADLTYADGTRVRSTRKDGRVIVHDKNIPGTSVVSSAKIYRKYNDPYDIFNRYNDRFINDLFQLFYSMKRDVQLSRKGGIIRKYSIGGPIDKNIKQQVFDWVSNKNGELRYAMNHGESYPTFYRLLRDANRPVLDLGDGYTGTHKLAYAQSGDKGYIYPDIQWTQDMNGDGSGIDYSQEDDWKIGWEHAYNNVDYLEIPTEEMAKYFTENYKTEYPQGFPGFDYNESTSLSGSDVWVPDPNFVPTIEDLAKQLTASYETYRSKPYILKTTNKDGSVTRQELIGHGLANKDIIEKYRQTGIPEDVSMNFVISTLYDLHNTFTKMVPNYSKLPGNVQLAILDTAYNTSGTNFGDNSPKFSALVDSGVTDPAKLITQLDHSKGIDSWLGDRSAARRALALGKFRWNWNHVDRYGRHLDPNKPVGSKDWKSSLYLGNY